MFDYQDTRIFIYERSVSSGTPLDYHDIMFYFYEYMFSMAQSLAKKNVGDTSMGYIYNV